LAFPGNRDPPSTSRPATGFSSPSSRSSDGRWKQQPSRGPQKRQRTSSGRITNDESLSNGFSKHDGTHNSVAPMSHQWHAGFERHEQSDPFAGGGFLAFTEGTHHILPGHAQIRGE
jgi:hypothetical protein